MVESKDNNKSQCGSTNLLFYRHPFLIGLFIRILVALFFPALFDHGVGVQYTDVDYYVFTDAAQLVQDGRSPYERHTYRYTPFLAALLAMFGNSMTISSRLLFCLADALCGYIILKLRWVSRRTKKQKCSEGNIESEEHEQGTVAPSDSLWWLYNPLSINICTRGSAESLVVLLPVLSCVAVATLFSFDGAGNKDNNGGRTQHKIIFQSILCGILLGIAVHMKIYPIIYTLSFMTYLSRREGAPCWQASPFGTQQHSKGSKIETILAFLKIWRKRLLRPPSILIFGTTVATWIGVTYTAVKIYGIEAWNLGIAYHVTRLDHRHNYSVYWYWIYLTRAAQAESSSTTTTGAKTTNTTGFGLLSRALFLPQVILLLVSSMGMAPTHLELTLFCQTFLFVMCNKVITGQYFTWYLVLLPLCADYIEWTSRPSVGISLMMLGTAVGTWLLSAYCLEMMGWSVHVQVWITSLFVFVANVYLFGMILDGYFYDDNESGAVVSLKEDGSAAVQKQKRP